MPEQPVDERVITAYLLGASSAAEAERLDEMSLTDEDFAWRLHAVENDLVDAYVRGELSGDALARFNSHYLASPRRREKVRFAETLLAFAEKPATARAGNQIAPELSRENQPAPVRATTASWRQRLAAFLPSPWLRSPALAFGSALAVLLLTVTGWLVWQTLRKSETEPERAATIPSPTVAPAATPDALPTASPTPAPEDVAAPVITQLNDGDGRVVLDREGKLSGADHLPPRYRRMVEEALTSERLEKSSLLQGLARPGSSLMSSDEQGNQFSVTEPVGKVVLTDRPTFRWSPLTGATGYVVEVYDEKFDLAATSGQLTANLWAAPQPLKRGGIYSWQVKAIKDGQQFSSPRPPAPQARFRILNQAKVNEIMQARRAYASSHLTLGLLYARAGLLDEAEREFRALQKANPDSALARRLLSQVRALRR